MKKIAKLSLTVLVMALFLSLTFIGCGGVETYTIWTGTITYSDFQVNFGQEIKSTKGYMCADNLDVTESQRDKYVAALSGNKENLWTEEDLANYIKSLVFTDEQAASLASRIISKDYCWMAVRDEDTVTLIIK